MGKKRNKILLAGFEIGGQMQLLVETFRKKGFDATSMAFNKDYMNFQNDRYIPHHKIGKRFLFFIYALRQYQIFHFFWGVSLISFSKYHLLDLPVLKLFGKKVFPHFRGSDIMSEAYSNNLLLFDKKKQNINFSNSTQKKRIHRWKKYATRTLVSTPNLLEIDRSFLLSPQVIDIDYWKTNKKPLSNEDGIIRIVHAPSNKLKKGTNSLENAVASLQNKGYKIELILAEKIDSKLMKALYEKADIGVDQLYYGWHGKVSCELMALEKPVICYIDEKYNTHNRDLPFVNATIYTLEERIEELLLDKKLRHAIGEKSRTYVETYHDVNKEADNLLRMYGLLQPSKQNT